MFPKETNVRNIAAGRNCLVFMSDIKEDYLCNSPVGKAALAAGENINFSRTDCIKSHQIVISQMHHGMHL